MYVHTNCRTVPPGIYGICKVSGDFQIIEYGRLNFRHSEMYIRRNTHYVSKNSNTQNGFKIYFENEFIWILLHTYAMKVSVLNFISQVFNNDTNVLINRSINLSKIIIPFIVESSICYMTCCKYNGDS